MNRIKQFGASIAVLLMSAAQAYAGGGGGGGGGGGYRPPHSPSGCHGGYCYGHKVPEIDVSQALLAATVLICAVMLAREISRRTLLARSH